MDGLTIGTRTIRLALGDITRQRVDAIVNAANSGLLGGGGVDGAIHRAGGGAIYNECKAIVAHRGPLPPGQALKTTGGNLPAKYVIHTVGPIWHGGGEGEAVTLASAYRESLRVAESYGLHTVAFPSISTGAYGYPVAEAAAVALAEVAHFLHDEARSVREVTFVLFDEATHSAYAAALERIANRA
jgi:O-acetyl-ADP-ribose deacetylase (regulator of RNase III)